MEYRTINNGVKMGENYSYDLVNEKTGESDTAPAAYNNSPIRRSRIGLFLFLFKRLPEIIYTAIRLSDIRQESFAFARNI